MGSGGELLSDLEVGACAPVARGQLVARIGKVGTFLPHLHFELRVYNPESDPEDAPRVVDPYGWTGAGEDPWAAGSKRKAVHRRAAVWVPEPASPLLGLTALATLGALVAQRV